MTMIEIFRNRVKKDGGLPALQMTRNGKTFTWTFQQYFNDCCYFAAAMIELGVHERSCLNVLGFNSAEWVIGYIGAMFANMISAGVYYTNGPDACVYIANHSEAQVVLVENLKQYHKYQEAKEKAKTVRLYILYGEPVPESLQGGNVLSWTEVIEIGRLTYEKHKEVIEVRMDKQTPATVCSYVYTSGTTSMPKGCMTTHNALTAYPIFQLGHYFNYHKVGTELDRVVSFLALSHVAAFCSDVTTNLVCPTTLYFAQPDALQGSLLKTLQEVRPTFFLAVPRVFEKIQEKLLSALSKKGAITQKLAQWAFSIGKEATENQLSSQSTPFGFSLAKALVLNKIKAEIGFDKIQMCAVGGAPLKKETFDFFAGIDLKMMALYGLSETGGSLTYCLPQLVRAGSIGMPVYGMTVKIINPSENGEGEICVRGKSVFSGYLKDAEKSKEVFDMEGFYHTGDLGYVDKDGYLFVTGRMKELLKTSGGEYIAPLLIETKFLSICQLCSQMVVVGESRNYLTALITIKSKPNKDGAPTAELTRDIIEFLSNICSSASNVTEASKCPKVHCYIAACIEKLNKHAISHAQQVRKWIILPREFSIYEEEITPTMKLRRNHIYSKYADVIEGMYKVSKL